MGILDFLKRGKKEEDIPDFGPAGDFPGAEPFPPPPGMTGAPPPFPTEPFPPSGQSYPLGTTPTFPTPGSVAAGQTPFPSQTSESETNRELERINHKLDLISERISKIEQTLDFMQRYVYSNR